jgi:hypothetical protein
MMVWVEPREGEEMGREREKRETRLRIGDIDDYGSKYCLYPVCLVWRKKARYKPSYPTYYSNSWYTSNTHPAIPYVGT